MKIVVIVFALFGFMLSEARADDIDDAWALCMKHIERGPLYTGWAASYIKECTNASKLYNDRKAAADAAARTAEDQNDPDLVAIKAINQAHGMTNPQPPAQK